MTQKNFVSFWEKIMNKQKLKKICLSVFSVIMVALIITGIVYLSMLGDSSKIKVADKPSPTATSNQPFVQDVSGDSENFRIPAIITLDSGRLVAAADARYDSTSDGGGLDTVVAYSDDNGKTWQSYTANFLGDNGNKFHKKSTSFIDPELLTDGKNIWMMTTFYSGGVALSKYTGLKPAVDKSAFDNDGMLLLSKNYGLSYKYKVDVESFENGYSRILKNTGEDTGYKIDEFFFLYDKNNNKIGNIFYVKTRSVFSVVPTTFLYMTKSVDGGETFGAPKLINAKKADEPFYGVGPGRGVVTSDGTMIMSAYFANIKKGLQFSSFIYSEDCGNTWQRSESLPSNEQCEYSGESQIVELPNGNLRCFFRNNSNRLCYIDAAKENGKYIWSDIVISDVEITSSCMLSVINVNNDGKNYILVSCPTGTETTDKGETKHVRADGKIFAFSLDDECNMTLKNTTSVKKDAFMYSCMSLTKDGNVAITYESEVGEITFAIYQIDSLIGQ